MDELSFNAAVRDAEKRMYAVARSMLRSDADCADAMQSAVFAAWRHLPSLRDESRFQPWLMRILVNACRDIQRGYQRRGLETPLDDSLPLPAGTGPDPELRLALAALPEKYRVPVALRHLGRLPISEIARALRLPPTTVKWRIHEGLKRLRKQMEEECI